MLPESDLVRLRHMLDAATEAVEHAKGRTREDLDIDRQLAHSLIRCTEIVGEAAAKLSEECRRSHPQIEWNNIIGMRNRLIHAYFDVNLAIIWRTVRDDLPVLASALQGILDSEDTC